MLTKEHSGSRIMRRCGQLSKSSESISYEKVIESPYAKKQGWKPGQFKVQYKDGRDGTVGWGLKSERIADSHTTPHSYDEILSLLGLSTMEAAP